MKLDEILIKIWEEDFEVNRAKQLIHQYILELIPEERKGENTSLDLFQAKQGFNECRKELLANLNGGKE